MFSLLLLLIFLTFFASSMTFNILGLFPHPGKSHFDVFEPLLKELTTRGHNLTVISHFPQKSPLSNYEDVSLRGDTDILLNFINLEELPKNRLLYYFSPILLAGLAKDSCKGLRTQQVQDFLKQNQKFDLIITELFNTNCFLGFVHKYQVPFIGLSSCTMMSWSYSHFGNPFNPSYIPVNFLPHSDKMSFSERVENTLYYLYADIMYKYFMEAPGYIEAKSIFGDDLPPLDEISRNVSLMLVNTHFSINLPKPLVPNIIEIGGMFLGKPKKIPQNLEKFIMDSSKGVIYFSMGSLIKAHTFGEDKRKEFLRAFSKLQEKVLWKWELESFPEKLNNILIQPWMPQFDILCHPNVVAFISHGGLLGTTEAIHCGVPMIVMPQFGDQFTNARAVEAVGAGVILDFTNITEESITEALNTVLQPSFKRQIEMLSARYRDRPLSPMDTAVYWVEYVARHKGAHFMRSSALHLAWYQTLLLDVLTFILILFILVLLCFYFTTKWLRKILLGTYQKEKVH